MSKWPKKIRKLSARQKAIKEDFMKHWHDVLPRKFTTIESFNHRYPTRLAKNRERVLELGSGLGEHINYEIIPGKEYWALELRKEMAREIKRNFPKVNVIVGDCQKKTKFAEGYFDRIIAVHVLEHLPDLPKALSEVNRILSPKGIFSVVIPCEGGWAYSMARNISARKIFEKRYGMSYDWFVETEHINLPHEIKEELQKLFEIVSLEYFPLRIPVVNANLVIGITMKKKRLRVE